MDNHFFGSGDDPAHASSVWYEQCSDGHPPIIYIAGLATFRSGMGMIRATDHVVSDCPVCTAITGARIERQEATGT